MELTKRQILNKTHYGLKIFAFILKKYYPSETVLSLSGRKCKPTKNPFNDNKSTLIIEIIDNCAVYTDFNKDIQKGDVFSFAELHYKLKGQKLLDKITNDLNLISSIEKPQIEFEETIDSTEPNKINKPIIPSFSYFDKPIVNTKPTHVFDLLTVFNYIRHSNYKNSTEQLRRINDQKKARKFKAQNFNYVTFSGVFSKRHDKKLLKHSGLLTIDFDHLEDVYTLKNKLIHDEYFDTELMFVSPSGDGLKWIIPIDLTKETHQNYFKAVANYIIETYNIAIDSSGKDISRACFLPHDPDAFINPKYLRKYEK